MNYLLGVFIAFSIGFLNLIAAADDHVARLITRTQTLSNIGDVKGALGVAQQNTNQILNPLDRSATPQEIEAIIDSLLKTELYYALNYSISRDHRIVYDFLSKISKNSRKPDRDKEHITIVTVISLAAQEYFWNEISTLNDLKDRIRCELRYGLFKKENNKLNVSHVLFLDESKLGPIVDKWITPDLINKMKILINQFKINALGSTYQVIKTTLDEKFGGGVSLPMDFLAPMTLARFRVANPMQLVPMKSEGDGMCGQHSLFIPTDGPLGNCDLEGNPRYKMFHAIVDNADNAEAKKLYLFNSGIVEHDDFVSFMEEKITAIGTKNPSLSQNLREKVNKYQIAYANSNSAAALEAINSRLNPALYDKFISLPDLQNALNTIAEQIADYENKLDVSGDRWRMFRNIILNLISLRAIFPELNNLLTPIDNVLDQLDSEINEKNHKNQYVLNNNDRESKLDEKLKLVFQSIYGFIGRSIYRKFNKDDLLLNHVLLNTFFEVCRDIAIFLGYETLNVNIQNLFDQNTRAKNILRKDSQFKNQRLEMIMLLPANMTAELLPRSNDPDDFLRESNDTLSQWMDSAAESTKLWAILHNLNVFVFSGGSEGLEGVSARPKCDINYVLKNEPYSAEQHPYDSSVHTHEKHLSTVILTSPTAKNVFLNKKPIHYDKFIQPGDYAAMARAIRHNNWQSDQNRYAAYP